MLKKARLEEKLGGAFGPYLHDSSYQHNEHAPALILDVLQKEIKMKPFDLGALSLQENILDTRDGMKPARIMVVFLDKDWVLDTILIIQTG